MYMGFCFAVDIWDDKVRKVIVEYPIVYADNFSEAVKYIEDYYGEDLCGFHVDCIAPGDLFKINEEIYNKYK